jgi:hypothetical protein
MCLIYVIYVSCVCLLIVVSNTYCVVVFFVVFVLVLCLVYPMLPVSLDCLFLIALLVPRTFIYVVFFVHSCVQHILRCIFVLFVFIFCLMYTMWPVSQEFPFLIVPSVFNNVYLEENVSNILYIKFKPFGFQAPKDF